MSLLATLLVACEKAPRADQSVSEKNGSHRATKVSRQSREDLESNKKELRRQIRDALEMVSLQERENHLAEIAKKEINTNPEIAAELLEHLSVDGETRNRTILELVEIMISKSPEEAIEWMKTLQSPEDMALAKSQIALRISSTDPDTAAEMILRPIESQELKEVEIQVLGAWVTAAPLNASKWVENLPAGETRSLGVRTVLNQWLQADSKAAFEWTSRLGNETLKQEATRAAAEALVATPNPVRDFLLEGADKNIRPIIDQEMGKIMSEIEGEDAEN